MGTSLSGLTPATTFDGLLKTSDNEPLDGTLKAISTGDGTDTILQLSNSALQIGGATTIESTDGNFFKIHDTTTPSQEFSINKPFPTLEMFDLGTTANTKLRLYNTYLRFQVGGATTRLSLDVSGNLGLGIENATAAARAHVKGSGATSATTSLLVQNSAGSELFKVTDDGIVTLGNSNVIVDGASIKRGSTDFNLGTITSLTSYSGHIFKAFDGAAYSEVMRVQGGDQFVGIGETTPTARLHLKGSGNDNTTTSLLVQNSVGTNMLLVQDDGVVRVGPNGQSNTLYNGSTKYSIANTTFFGNTNASYFARLEHNVGFQIGNGSSTPTARLQVKGSGATSATTALLVQNSAGTDLLKVRDDGAVYVEKSNLAVKNSAFLGYGTDRSVGIGTGSSIFGTSLNVKGKGNDATTTALLVQNSDGTDGFWSKDDGSAYVRGNFGIGTPSPGQALSVIGTQIISGRITANGGITASNAQSTFKGSGATSATTALLVENSAGTELLKVRDDGTLLAPQAVIADFIFNVSTLMPNNSQSLGSNTSLNRHFTNAYFKGVAHITDNVISNTTYDASAKLQVDSTTKGFLPPRMTTTQRDAITTPAAGLMVYNTTTNKAQCYNGTAWQDLF